MKIILLGPPGAGKGTQCKRIAQRYDAVHLSSGDILRRHRAKGTDLGIEAQQFMDRGELVPDEVIVKMMAEEIKNCPDSGFLLDGFPRTVVQAKALRDELAEENLMAGAQLFSDF